MDPGTARRRRRRLTVTLAVLGFLIGSSAGTYSQLNDSSPPHYNVALWTALIIVCPPSLVSVALVDVEPGTIDFAVMWLVITIANSALYAVIGLALGCLAWKPVDHGIDPPDLLQRPPLLG